MRSFILAAVTLAIAVTAETIPGLPSCTSGCISSDFDGCGSLNVTCICSNKNLIANLACCVSTACDKADQDTTLAFADKLCAANSVSDLPQSATCAPGLSATASSSAATSSASTTAAGNSTASTASTTGSSSATGASATKSSASASASASATGAANKAAAYGVGAVVLGALAAL